jgi:hypothetical protein
MGLDTRGNTESPHMALQDVRLDLGSGQLPPPLPIPEAGEGPMTISRDLVIKVRAMTRLLMRMPAPLIVLERLPCCALPVEPDAAYLTLSESCRLYGI